MLSLQKNKGILCGSRKIKTKKLKGEKGKREEKELKTEQRTVSHKVADSVLRQMLATLESRD